MALRPPEAVREDAARGTNIGFPVAATDRESPASSFGEKLTYWLGTADSDEAKFSIDAATGQLKTKDTLDYENDTDDATFDASVSELPSRST